MPAPCYLRAATSLFHLTAKLAGLPCSSLQMDKTSSAPVTTCGTGLFVLLLPKECLEEGRRIVWVSVKQLPYVLLGSAPGIEHRDALEVG